MMRPLFILATACTMLLLVAPPAPTGAQEPQVITFHEALRIALDRSTELQRARADLGLWNAIQTRERMDFLPSLSLSTRGSRSFGRSFSQEEGEILSETNDIFDVGVNASVSLFDGFEKFASLSAATLEEEASRLRLERARQDVLFQVVQGFTTLVLDRELADVREEELRAADDLLRQVRRLVDVGRQPRSDLYQQEAAHAEAEALLVEARRQVGLSETTLMQLLQLNPLAEYEFRADTLEPADTADSTDASELRELLSLALRQRPDLTAAETGVEASAQSVRAARSGWWPSLSLSLNYGSNWSRNSRQPIPGTGTEPETIRITPDGGGNPVTLPVPGTGSDPLFLQPSFWDQLDGRRYDLQDQIQLVALQVRQSLLDYRASVAQQRATTRRLVAAERAWEAALRRYELGAATFVEVAQARSALAAARSAAVSARYNVVLARRLIDYHTGSLTVDAVSTGRQESSP